MHIDYKQKQLQYQNELWLWKGKSIPLKKLHENQLLICKKFLETNPKGLLNGQDKSYLLEAVNYVLKSKQHQENKKTLNRLKETFERRRIVSVDKFLKKTIIYKLEQQYLKESK
jgi:hypothetical protein